MVFEVVPFAVCAAGSLGLGTGAWYAGMGNTPTAWSTCLGKGRKGHTLRSDRSPEEILAALHQPSGQGHKNISAERAHTGKSPRLSHIIDTMAGTNKGSTFDPRAPEARHNYSNVER